MPDDSLYVRRAMLLASFGLGLASPAPLIAWVFVKKKQIIKEGWLNTASFTSTFAHNIAHINLKGSKLYLNINPLYLPDQECETFLDILTKHLIKCLVIPDGYSSSHAKNKAIPLRYLASLKNESYWLNRRFFTWKEVQRPYIILKWAQTSDGFIARKNYDSKWISNSYSRKLVHQWRSQEDAVMVGTNTCQYDNPQLNVRDWSGKNPVRIVLDRKLRLDPQLHVFDHSQPTICYNLSRSEQQDNLEYVPIIQTDYRSFLEHLLFDLHKRKIQSLFVEGGAQLLTLLIRNGWWDEARIFQSEVLFYEGIKAPSPEPARLIREEHVRNDRLLFYQKLNKK